MEIIDQLSRKISLKKTPQRIISLVPSQTELLVHLGLEDKIVGITKFCVHPAYLRKTKNVVGGTKQVNLEKVKALQPDIILCNKEENTLEMVQELEKIAPVHISDIGNLEEAFKMMQKYGEIFSCKPLAETMISSIKLKIESLQQKKNKENPIKVVYFIWKKPWMVAGKDTFIDSLLKINNFRNIIENSRYPRVSLEEIKRKSPDVILLSSEPFPFKEKHKEIFKKFDAKIILVDGEYFSWYGSRLLEAIDYFKNLKIRP